jgi:hypothetical protein
MPGSAVGDDRGARDGDLLRVTSEVASDPKTLARLARLTRQGGNTNRALQRFDSHCTWNHRLSETLRELEWSGGRQKTAPAFSALAPSMAVGRKDCSCVFCTCAIHGGRQKDMLLRFLHSRHSWRSAEKTAPAFSAFTPSMAFGRTAQAWMPKRTPKAAPKG